MVKNLDPTAELKTVVGDEKTNLIAYAWQQKKRNIQDNTIANRMYLLGQLIKLGVDLLNPDSFETVVATEPMSKAKKRNFVSAYRSYTKVNKISWEPIKVGYEPKQPFIPTGEEISALIHAAGKRLATFLQVLADTGARVGEVCQLQWTDVNVKNCTIAINNPEKHSRAQTLTVTQKTIAMIQALPNPDKYGNRIFNANPDTIAQGFSELRKRLAENQKNPRFKQIHLHTFRHYYACTLYSKTKILKTVQDALGHKSITNTEIYTKLVVFHEEKYYSATAKTVEEACQLIEDGWSYHVEIDGIKIFRKPK
jgi:integrase